MEDSSDIYMLLYAGFMENWAPLRYSRSGIRQFLSYVFVYSKSV